MSFDSVCHLPATASCTSPFYMSPCAWMWVWCCLHSPLAFSRLQFILLAKWLGNEFGRRVSDKMAPDQLHRTGDEPNSHNSYYTFSFGISRWRYMNCYGEHRATPKTEFTIPNNTFVSSFSKTAFLDNELDLLGLYGCQQLGFASDFSILDYFFFLFILLFLLLLLLQLLLFVLCCPYRFQLFGVAFWAHRSVYTWDLDRVLPRHDVTNTAIYYFGGVEQSNECTIFYIKACRLCGRLNINWEINFGLIFVEELHSKWACTVNIC